MRLKSQTFNPAVGWHHKLADQWGFLTFFILYQREKEREGGGEREEKRESKFTYNVHKCQ